MLKRKVYRELYQWLRGGTSNVLVIEGIHGSGKSTTVRAFTREKELGYQVIWLDARKELKNIDITGRIVKLNYVRFLMEGCFRKKYVPGKFLTVIDHAEVLDESSILAWIRLYEEEGCSPLIVVNGGIPLQREGLHKLKMRTLDYEEFLWAIGVSMHEIATARWCLAEHCPVEEDLHGRLQQALEIYLMIGGFPKVVSAFLKEESVYDAFVAQEVYEKVEQAMLEEIHGKPAQKKSERIMDVVPVNLAGENKKFCLSLLEEKATNRKYMPEIMRLEQMGYLGVCYNLAEPELSEQAIVRDTYEIFRPDIGWYVSELDQGLRSHILTRDVAPEGHAIWQSLFADFMIKAGMEHQLRYFRRNTGLSIDFMIPGRNQKLVPVSMTNRRRSRSIERILAGAEYEAYGIEGAVVFDDANVEELPGRKILRLPYYMGYFLAESIANHMSPPAMQQSLRYQMQPVHVEREVENVR